MVAIRKPVFAGLLVSATSSVSGAPLEPLDLAAGNSLESRNPVVISVIARTGFSLIRSLAKAISNFGDDQHAVQDEFTKGMIRQLQLEYPYKNVIIYHNQDSIVDFEGAVHDHHELDIGMGFTKGYETYVFDSGKFIIAGDGGFINRAFAGNHVKNDNEVTFYPIPVPSIAPPPIPETPVLPPMTPERASNANDGNYLVNCKHPDGTLSSGVAYYSNLNPGANVGQLPDDYVDVTHGSHYNWEQVGQVIFPTTETTVRWSIFGDSQSRASGESAGTADNGYQNFWTYKDGGDFLYEIDSWTCDSIYWAF